MVYVYSSPRRKLHGHPGFGVNRRAGDHLHVLLLARELHVEAFHQDAQRHRRLHHREHVPRAPPLPAAERHVREIRGGLVRVQPDRELGLEPSPALHRGVLKRTLEPKLYNTRIADLILISLVDLFRHFILNNVRLSYLK